MKKIYMIPSIKVAKVKAPQILAGSPNEGDNPVATGTIDNESGIASKRGIGFIDYFNEDK